MRGTLLGTGVWLSLLLLLMAGGSGIAYRWMRSASFLDTAWVWLAAAGFTYGSFRLSVRFYDRRRRGMYG